MDASQTEKLKALALAATEGPWHWVNSENDKPRQPGEWRASLRTIAEYPTRSGVGLLPKFIVCADEIGDENMEANAAFMAELNPATVLELIAEVERLRAENEALLKGCKLSANWINALEEGYSAPAAGTEKDAEREATK